MDRVIKGIVVVLFLCFVISCGKADEWEKVNKSSDMDVEIQVKVTNVTPEGYIETLVKNVCLGEGKCSVDILMNFCKFWSCGGDFQGDKEDKTPAKYAVKTCVFDCKENRYKMFSQKWYSSDDRLLATIDYGDDSWTVISAKPVDGAYEMFTGIKDAADYICREKK
jgi:hypothetical protein